MLPSSPHVREVYLGSAGLLQSVQPGSLLIDCSTIGPATAREVAAAAASLASFEGLSIAADAPVSGGAWALAVARGPWPWRTRHAEVAWAVSGPN